VHQVGDQTKVIYCLVLGTTRTSWCFKSGSLLIPANHNCTLYHHYQQLAHSMSLDTIVQRDLD